MVRLGAVLLLASPLLAACAAAQEPETNEPVTSSDVTGTLFVANKRGNTLSKVDLSTGEEVLRRDSCTNPHELATSPDGKRVALACYGGTTIDVFSVEDLKKLAKDAKLTTLQTRNFLCHARLLGLVDRLRAQAAQPRPAACSCDDDLLTTIPAAAAACSTVPVATRRRRALLLLPTILLPDAANDRKAAAEEEEETS